MKAFHLRNNGDDYTKNMIYIPERDLLVAFLKEKAYSIKIDYSMPYYLKTARDIIEGKPTEIKFEIVKEFEIDGKTAGKIESKKDKSMQDSESSNAFDGSTEGLIKILME